MNAYFILFLLMFSLTISAQKSERVSGEYIYYAPINKSLEEAKQTALERAKLEALADKFGTTIALSNFTNIKNENGNSSIDFQSIGGSEIKGEWLETIGKPIFQISFDQNQLIIKVNVCGKARAIAQTLVEFKANLLCNGIEEKFRSEEFHNGDDLFLSFCSPIDGFLIVYLVDNNENAYCLLPYRHSSTGSMSIKHGQHYVFFSKKTSNTPSEVDEYILTSEQEIERNRLYIIFSSLVCTKANDEIINDTLPRKLPFTNFQKWLSKNRNRDKTLQVEVKDITINK